MNQNGVKYCDRCLQKGQRVIIGWRENMDFYAWCSRKYCPDCAKEIRRERDRIRKRQWRKDTRKERAELRKQVDVLRNQTDVLLESLDSSKRENLILRNRLVKMGVRVD